jgi:hypothetical protein
MLRTAHDVGLAIERLDNVSFLTLTPPVANQLRVCLGLACGDSKFNFASYTDWFFIAKDQ